MSLQEQLVSWDNLRLAYQNAARGKRGFTRHQTRPPACPPIRRSCERAMPVEVLVFCHGAGNDLLWG